jgi:hypothetical protein
VYVLPSSGHRSRSQDLKDDVMMMDAIDFTIPYKNA